MMSKSELNRSGIYQILNTNNGKCYVGSAVNIRKRWEVHKTGLRKNSHHSKPLQCSWIKYGEDSFKLVVLEYVEKKDELLDAEQRWIDQLKSVAPSGYNIRPSARSNLGRIFSDEVRKNMSNAAKGRKHTEETKKKISIGGRRPCSDETKAKISASNKGKKRSLEVRAKIAAREVSQESLARLLAAAIGRKVSDETREKLSKAKKGKPKSKEHREKIRQALINRNIIKRNQLLGFV